MIQTEQVSHRNCFNLILGIQLIMQKDSIKENIEKYIMGLIVG